MGDSKMNGEIITLRNKNTGETIKLRRKLDIGEISTPQTFQQEDLERRISQRPDIYGQAVQSLQRPPQNPLGYNPLEAANIGLQSLGGVAQRAEAVIANPFLRQQGRFQNPLQAIKQGITGEQLGELGDIARQAGLPEPISAGLGLLGTGIIGGALSRWVGLGQKANNLTKLETTYGKDIAKNIITQTTELPRPLVERGMQRGWRKILTKSNARELDLPTKVSSYVINSLDDITQKEYDEFGKVLDKVKTGNIKAIDLNQVIENTLKQNGYLDEAFSPTLKSRGAVVNKIQNFIDTANKSGMKPDDNIPIDVIQTFKKIMKGLVPEKNWIGKTRSLKGEQRLAKDLSNSLDNLIAYNSYGIEDVAYTQAKRNYSIFKNFEQAIMNTFSEVVGQEVKPTADKIVGISKLHPTKMLEEMGKLYNIDDFLKSKGYQPIADKLLDWMTTQEMLIKPQGGFFKEMVAVPIKYGVRQSLQSGVPTTIGGKTGGLMNQVNPYVIPPSILRMITGRDKSREN